MWSRRNLFRYNTKTPSTPPQPINQINGFVRHRTPSRHLSPILLRILALNVLALVILVGSLLYLGRYHERIIANELEAMQRQARIIASAVAEGAVVTDRTDHSFVSPLLAQLMVKRLAETTEMRTRLFGPDESQLADSRVLIKDKTSKLGIEATDIPPLSPNWAEYLIAQIFDILDQIYERRTYPLWVDPDPNRSPHFEIVSRAVRGEAASQVWSRMKGGLRLTVAIPVERNRKILGAVMLSRSDEAIDKAIYAVRIDILRIFGITLLITSMLSFYLARAIARPIRQLARAAEGLSYGQMQQVGLAGTASLLSRNPIPDMTSRRDEIGDLSAALRELTAALAQRIGAIENFAADVSHELKNPLTSLRSAVETVDRVKDPEAVKKLLSIIHDDVDRLDRLITDIANASRLDAELSRSESQPLDLGEILTSLVDYYQSQTNKQDRAEVFLRPLRGNCIIKGIQQRLVQVFQNLIDNALSFAPPNTEVTVKTGQLGHDICVIIEDEGPGIPENKLEAIFDRFYSERPKAEKFGTHSGLGLSIARQIIIAHRGRIWAENRKDVSGKIMGARFVVVLPMVADTKNENS